MMTFTVGYAVGSHHIIVQKMLKPSDRKFDHIKDLRVTDFIPSQNDKAFITESIRFFVLGVLKNLADAKGINLSKLDYSYPRIIG